MLECGRALIDPPCGHLPVGYVLNAHLHGLITGRGEDSRTKTCLYNCGHFGCKVHSNSQAPHPPFNARVEVARPRVIE